MRFQSLLKTVISLLVAATPIAAHSSQYKETPRCNLEAWAKTALDPAKDEVGYGVGGNPNGPVLILIHGMGGDGGGWEDVIRNFAPYYKIVVYQQRGHGMSAARGEDYSTMALAADLKRLTDHLGLKKFSIIGHSMGARVAARFTTLYPDQVEKLIIEDMDLIQRTSSDPEKQRRAVLKSREVARRMADGFDTRQEMADALYPFFNAPDLAGVMGGAVRNSQGKWVSGASLKPSTYILYWNQANSDSDLLQGLAKANRPTLMIRADHRKFWTAMTNEGVRQVHAIFPKAKIVTVRGADHSVHNSQPSTYMQVVDGFLSQP